VNDAELIALAGLVHADATAMMLANMDRQAAGKGMAYTDDMLWSDETYKKLEAELTRRGVLSIEAEAALLTGGDA